jgi:hypothetical protein
MHSEEVYFLALYTRRNRQARDKIGRSQVHFWKDLLMQHDFWRGSRKIGGGGGRDRRIGELRTLESQLPYHPMPNVSESKRQSSEKYISDRSISIASLLITANGTNLVPQSKEGANSPPHLIMKGKSKQRGTKEKLPNECSSIFVVC